MRTIGYSGLGRRIRDGSGKSVDLDHQQSTVGRGDIYGEQNNRRTFSKWDSRLASAIEFGCQRKGGGKDGSGGTPKTRKQKKRN